MSNSLYKRIQVSPRRWILLPIGFALKTRDFHGYSILAFETAERGWGVIIGSKAIRANKSLPRGMLIENNVSPGTGNKVTMSLKHGHRLSACDQEGLVYNNAEEYGRRKIEKSTYDLLDMFFCWGQHQASDLVDKLGCSPDKILITGNPRFDLHRPELRDVFARRASQIRKEHGPFILINTKFSQHNGYFSPQVILAKMRAMGTLRTPEQEAEALGQIEFHRVGFEKFVELVEKVSQHFPQHNVVIRPHPSERHEPWKAKAATLPNVKVICKGNVVEWILASDACVHNNCTTGVESYLLDKPAISYRPLCDSRFDLYLPNALSDEAFNVSTVLDLLSRQLCHQKTDTLKESTNRAAIAANYIENVGGRLACERLADALEPLDLPVEPLTYSSGVVRTFKASVGERLRSTRRKVKSVLKTESPWRTETAARARNHALKSNELTKRELVDFLRSLQQVSGRFCDIKVAELENELLCIYK